MIDFRDSIVRKKIAANVKTEIFASEAAKRPNRFKTRLAPSSLGEECAAKTWYDFRWVTPPKPADGRMSRYNRKGEENEADIVARLRETGWTVDEIDPATGEQWAINGYWGHLYGKTDGIASHPVHTEGQRILLEFKYINYKRFSTFINKSLIEADLKYYCQINLYMSELNLPACMFVPENRNDADVTPIIIPRDDAQVDIIRQKADTILTTRVRPARVAESAAFFMCKSCDHVEVCHNGALPTKNCRSCINAMPTDGGKFFCSQWNAVIPNKDAILTACDEWSPVR